MPGERFHVRLLPEDGGGPGERVVVEVSTRRLAAALSGGAWKLARYLIMYGRPGRGNQVLAVYRGLGSRLVR